MIYLNVFVRMHTNIADVMKYLKTTYDASFHEQYECVDIGKGVSNARVSVKTNRAVFTLAVTEFLTTAASVDASKRIYLGSAEIKDREHLTQLTFKCFVPCAEESLMEIVVPLVETFGGGYITSDGISVYPRTYAEIQSKESQADHTSVFSRG